MTTVAFIGLGAMGAPMALNLHEAGFKLRVYNRDRAKTAPFAARSIAVADSPAAAVSGASFVVSIVSDDAATREVMLGPEGVVPAASPGAVIIDSSTNTPGMAREAATAAGKRRCTYLDAPVTGSIAQAKGRELVFMVGGERPAFEQAQPVLAAMGKQALYMGASGAGATVKLINNMVSAALTATLAEAAQAIEAAGLDRQAALAVLNEGAAGSRLSRNKLPKMLGRDFSPQFQLELMEKDVRYFLALAQELDCPSPIAALVRSQYQAARRAALGKLDSCAVFLLAAGETPPERQTG